LKTFTPLALALLPLVAVVGAVWNVP